MKNNLPPARGFGKKDEFILLQPECDEFLALFEETKDCFRMGWCSSPAGAMRFASEDLARAAAQKVLQSKEAGYQLIICQLHDLGSQWGVMPVGEPLEAKCADFC